MHFLIEESETADGHPHVIQDFCTFVCARLGILEQPQLTLVDSTGFPSFGSYRPHTGDVTVATNGRHIADVLRTLAHELVHHIQILSGSPLDLDGLEYEANAVAGMLMREYNREHPELYGAQQDTVPADSLDDAGVSYEEGIADGQPMRPPYPIEVAEEAPVNAAGSGAVAGIGVGPQGEPGIRKTTKTPMFKRKPFKQFREQLKETPWQTF